MILIDSALIIDMVMVEWQYFYKRSIRLFLHFLVQLYFCVLTLTWKVGMRST